MRHAPQNSTCTVVLASAAEDPAVLSLLQAHYSLVFTHRTLHSCIQFLRTLAGSNTSTLVVLDMDSPPSLVPTAAGSPSGSPHHSPSLRNSNSNLHTQTLARSESIALIKILQSEVGMARGAATIVIGSVFDEDVTLRALQAGAHDFYLKPLTPQLVSTLHLAALRRRALALKSGGSSESLLLDGDNSRTPFNASPSDRAVLTMLHSFGNPLIDVRLLGTFPTVDPSDAAMRKVVLNWDFNALAMSENDLLAATVVIFQELDLFDTFKISIDVFKRFVLALRSNYNKNPFHNFEHAVDVLQATFWTLATSGLRTQLKPLEVLALAISSLAHDVCHPGTNNFYHINARSSLALLYNNKAVLENLHASMTFALLLRPELNLFGHMSPAEVKELRGLIISAILATDMGMHFDFISTVKERNAKKTPLVLQAKEDASLVSTAVIKSADLSNTVRSFSICQGWAHKLFEEFTNQGQTEKRLGLPILPYGAESVVLWITQKEFLTNVTLPFFEQCAQLLPIYDRQVEIMKQNVQRWMEIGQSEDGGVAQMVGKRSISRGAIPPTLQGHHAARDVDMDAASPGPASASPAAGAAAGTPDGVKRTPSVKERFAANAGVKMKPRRKGFTHRRACSDATLDMLTAVSSSAMYTTPAHSITNLLDEDAGVSKYQPEPSFSRSSLRNVTDASGAAVASPLAAVAQGGFGADAAMAGKAADVLARRRHSVAVPGF